MRNLLFLIVSVCMLYSCAGTPKEREVTVSNVEITGFLKDYVKVVDGSYKFTVTGREASISVKLELVNKPLNYCKAYSDRIRLNPIGDGNEIYDTGIYGFDAQDNELQKVRDLLNGNVDDTKTVSFKWQYFAQHEDLGNAIMSKSISFELIDKAFEECSDSKSSYTDDSDSEDTSVSNSFTSTADWDEVLDEYEKYIDSCVNLMKKQRTVICHL
jgi:hypothetical protein